MSSRDYGPTRASSLTLLLLLASSTSAFYLPGVAPTSYKDGDRVPLHVNRLTPAQSRVDAQVKSVFSYDYYAKPFHFCKPAKGPKQVSESLGSILFGDRIQTSPFELRMGKNETCKTLCDNQLIEAHDAKFVNRRIMENYNLNWLVDGLPAGQVFVDDYTNEEFYTAGFGLGEILHDRGGEPALHNHYNIDVDYHDAGKKDFRVVGILVHALSLNSPKGAKDGEARCDASNEPMVLSEKDDNRVTYTYSVHWRPSDTSFATRWDKFLQVDEPQIHWLSLVVSAITVVFLISMVTTVLIRTLRKDIARYNRLDAIGLDDLSGTGLMEEGVQEDSGWKLVHGDVFRPPKHTLLLSVLIGNGAQLFIMTGLTIAFALLGFLSPSNRGSLGSVILLLYTFLGFVGGYVSAKVYKFFQGESWKANFALTPVAVPGFVFATFFLLNLFVWARHASGAVPFTTMIVIVVMWFVISVPLSLAGSWLGFRGAAVEPPVRTNQIPRQIPRAQGYLRPIPSMLAVGLLPFFAIWVELYFIMNSIWFNKVYYMFGFLFICYGLMIMTCAAVTVLMVYFLLCAENYHWQWRSFCLAGASAAYVFVYALAYWVQTLSFSSWTGGVLYLGYSALISVLVFILTGTIGFFSTWLFVLKIYRSIKID